MAPNEIRFSSADGLSLEGALDRPQGARAALVLCHPHPDMGGSMNAPLLLAIRDDLVAGGWAVLRFNFRGVGGSEGAASTGTEEIADAQGAIAKLRRSVPEVPIAIAGWSFGGAVAVKTAERDDSLTACAAIAPAVRTSPGVTDGLPPAEELDLGVPLLFVCGTNDRVVSPEDCERWIHAVPEGTYVAIPGANHFFWGKYEKLSGVIRKWLDERSSPKSLGGVPIP